MSFPNRYRSTCYRCGGVVEAGAGVCVKQDGEWAVRHPGRKCPENVEQPAPKSDRPAEEMVLITGDTYSVRDQLKAMGGRWDAGAKGWRVPTSRAAEAQALVPARKKRERKSYGPKLVGERTDLTSNFEGSKHDREPHRSIGESVWLRHGGQRIACIVVGYERASWCSGDMLEDMGNYEYGGRGAYLGIIYYRRATRAEALALAEKSPREDAVIPEE